MVDVSDDQRQHLGRNGRCMGTHLPVLLSPNQNSAFSLSISWLSTAADNVNKDPNKANFVNKNVRVNAQGVCHCAETYEQVRQC